MKRKNGDPIKPEYQIWASMKCRCMNPKHADYKYYGGRGIDVCDDWMAFEEFYKDMGDRPSSKHSLDRTDCNKGYSRENCRWATRHEQANNRRNNVWIEVGFCKLTIAQWERERGFPPDTIRARLQRGWSQERAVFEPLPKPSKIKQAAIA